MLIYDIKEKGTFLMHACHVTERKLINPHTPFVKCEL